MDLQEKLFEMQDLKYRDFHSKLMPTVDKERVIGIRVPALRKFATGFAKSGEAQDFLKALPHKYYEENNLHAFIVEKIKDFDEALYETEKFLPYIDNWATCDMFFPKVFAKNKEKLLSETEKWIKSSHTYTVRYGIVMLMRLYLDEDFDEKYLNAVAEIKSEEYYVNMAVAWYFATALDKQYDSAIRYIEQKRLDKWVHNKAIQKAIESYRITKETKEYLKSLKIR